jgi:nucleotide-binding universal stress UspA family protein
MTHLSMSATLTERSAMSLSSIQRIVVATDFSRSATVATAWAGRLATMLGAEIHLVHGWILPVLVSPAGAYLAELVSSGTLESELETALKDAGAGHPVTGRHLLHTTPEQAVGLVVQEVHADLVVVGAQGASALEHVVFGSVAERIVRTASVPVVVVPHAFESALARPELVRAITAAIELAPSAHAVIGLARLLARSLHAPLRVVHVAQEAASAGEAASSRALQVEMAQVLNDSQQARPDIESLQLLRGDPAAQLVSDGNQAGTDLMVMGSRGRRGLARFFLGSVTERVIRDGHSPVLVLPPGS